MTDKAVRASERTKGRRLFWAAATSALSGWSGCSKTCSARSGTCGSRVATGRRAGSAAPWRSPASFGQPSHGSGPETEVAEIVVGRRPLGAHPATKGDCMERAGDQPAVTETTVRPCRYCRAGYDSDAEMCGFAHHHPTEVVAPLATAMARIFQDRNPTDEQIGWFMEDAEAVIDDFDPVPQKWRLRKLPMGDHDEFIVRFRINDVTYVIEDGEGHIPPVRLATLRAWRREAEASHA